MQQHEISFSAGTGTILKKVFFYCFHFLRRYSIAAEEGKVLAAVGWLHGRWMDDWNASIRFEEIAAK